MKEAIKAGRKFCRDFNGGLIRDLLVQGGHNAGLRRSEGDCIDFLLERDLAKSDEQAREYLQAMTYPFGGALFHEVRKVYHYFINVKPPMPGEDFYQNARIITRDASSLSC